jgi:glycosyltransferase involved in cell wall biosynthesis
MVESAAVIVRTQGYRNSALLRALHSIADQEFDVTAIIVVHGDRSKLAEIESLASGVQNLKFVILHHENLLDKRGAPLNTGLRYIRSNGFDAWSILDDDDMIYPMFWSELSLALREEGVDFVYSKSNQRFEGKLASGPEAFPALRLLLFNFIPINTFAMKTTSFSDIFFDESLDYLEDWAFFLELLSRQAGIKHLPLVLSEYTVRSPENYSYAQDPDNWHRSANTIINKIRSREFQIKGSEIELAFHTFNPTPHYLICPSIPEALGKSPTYLHWYSKLPRRYKAAVSFSDFLLKVLLPFISVGRKVLQR